MIYLVPLGDGKETKQDLIVGKKDIMLIMLMMKRWERNIIVYQKINLDLWRLYHQRTNENQVLK